MIALVELRSKHTQVDGGMDISMIKNDKIFDKYHKIGMNMLFKDVHKKINIVVGVKSDNTEYLVPCIISRNRRTQESYKDNTQDIDKYLIKIKMEDIKFAKSITTTKIPIQINKIDYIKYSGTSYDIYRDTINNQTQDLLILEITNFKW